MVWSDPGMPGRQGRVEVVGAHGVVLPAHRVVKGVHAGVAPVPVEVELGQGGAAARQLEQLLAGLQGNLCLLYTSPSPRDLSTSRMPSSA